jgi:hypothetical protein
MPLSKIMNTELPMPDPFSTGERIGGNQIIFPTIESKAPKGQKRQSDNWRFWLTSDAGECYFGGTKKGVKNGFG